MIKAILMFNDTKENVTNKGFDICDGSNGTPDLRDKFVKGARTKEEMGLTGGSTSHSHDPLSLAGSHSHNSYSSGTHRHSNSSSNGGNLSSMPSGNYTSSASHNHTSTTSSTHSHDIGNAEHLPPFYSLIYALGYVDITLIPKGSILLTFGYDYNIPDDFSICDGTLGTPDLRDMFVMGSATDIGLVQAGDHLHTIPMESSHTHTSDSSYFSHNHDVSGSGGISDSWTGTLENQGPNHSHSTGSDAGHTHNDVIGHDTEPPFYKLMYIKKIN